MTRHIGVVFYKNQIRGIYYFNKLVDQYRNTSELLSKIPYRAHFADGTIISLHSPVSTIGVRFDKVYVDKEMPFDVVENRVIAFLRYPIKNLEDMIRYY